MESIISFGEFGLRTFKIDLNSNINFNSFVIAMCITTGFINGVIRIDNISMVSSAILYALFFYGCVSHKMIIPVKRVVIVLGIMCVFMLSIISIPDDALKNNYFQKFWLQCFIPFMMGGQQFDEKKVIQYVTCIGVIFAPFMYNISFNDLNSGNWMGYAYSMLPILMAAILGLKRSIGVSIGSVFIIIAFFKFYIQYAVRGVWVTLGVFILFLITDRVFRNSLASMRICIMVLFSVGFLSAGVLIWKNLVSSVQFLTELLQYYFGFRVYALDKIIRYAALGKLDNGRNRLFTEAVNLFYESPLWGHGIGYFESIHDGAYTHNVFLQALCEGGVLFLIPIIWVYVKYLACFARDSLKGSTRDNDLLILLFCSSLVVLLFSSVIWQYSIAWLAISYILKRGYQR